MSEYVINSTSASFEQDVLKSDIPVLVDYWATWCAPCKMIAPVLEEIAREYQGRLKVCKVDIEENEDISVRYAVRNMPTLMLFRNGVVEASKSGSMSKSQMAAFIDGNL